MTRWVSVAVVLLLALTGGCGYVAIGPVTDLESAEAYVDRWLVALTTNVETGGFELLHPDLRSDATRERYLDALNGFTGEGIRWEVGDASDRDASADAAFYSVQVDVEGGSAAFPDQLFDMLVMQRSTVDGRDVGIFVVVKVDGAGTGIWIPIGG